METKTTIEIDAQSAINLNLVNAAGITSKSIEQANSMFTLTAIFKDQKRSKLHSWRQEIRGKELLTDQRHAFERLKLLAEVCKCNYDPNKCFHCNHTSILIYCNITDSLVYKSVYGKLKSIADLNFAYAESGSVYLVACNNVNVTRLSVNQAKKNRLYFNQNK